MDDFKEKQLVKAINSKDEILAPYLLRVDKADATFITNKLAPFSNIINVGKPRTPYLFNTSGWLSAFNLTIFTWPAYSSANASSTGEIIFNFKGTSNEVLNVPLLYQEDGVSVTVVNNWLVDLKSNRYRKQVNTQAQALLHYFIFLDSVGLEWDDMPVTPRNKPTYKFSKYLRDAFRSGTIARSTANNYLGAVVNFYKF